MPLEGVGGIGGEILRRCVTTGQISGGSGGAAGPEEPMGTLVQP